jgi:hypothetical protein
MVENSWREVLKSSSLRAAYALLRRVKREVLNEPLAGVVPTTIDRWSVQAHLPLIQRYPDRGRLLFSLALAYLDRAGAGDLDKARACLRSARAVDFESLERVRLYLAVIDARQGNSESARALCDELPEYEWIDAEAALLREAAAPRWAVPERVPRPAPEGATPFGAPPHADIGSARSVLVVGDDTARTASWAAAAEYYLVASDVTGVDVSAAALVDRRFDLGLCPISGPVDALRSKCDDWMSIDFEAVSQLGS